MSIARESMASTFRAVSVATRLSEGSVYQISGGAY